MDILLAIFVAVAVFTKPFWIGFLEGILKK